MRKNRMLVVILLLAFAVVALTLKLGGFADGIQSQPPPVQNVAAGCGLLRIYIINVSQADAILIITPENKTMLIDSGSGMKPHSADNAVAFLKNMNMSRIDYLIASHYHEDHIGGMEDIFDNFEVGTIYDNGNCGNYSSGVQRTFEGSFLFYPHVVVAHDVNLSVDSCISAQLVAPYDRPQGCWPSNKDTSNENENSVVLRIVYGNTSFLLAGDCEEHCEQILAQRSDIKSDFAKVDHHGSATSSTPPFLAAVGARYYAISTDKARSVTDGYYHPRQAALSNIYSAGGNTQKNLFRTDLNGDISVVSDGSAITISTAAHASECELFSGYSSASISSYGAIPALAGSCG